jgi:ribosomal protein S18 acetylase RimI-like enzyme
MSAELDAALRFLARVDDAVAGELVPLDWGTGVFDRERPLVWDGNYVRAARTAGLEALDLAGSAEPLFAERGVAHRMVLVNDEREGKRLGPGFEALGWLPRPEVVMASKGRPANPKHRVEEVSVDQLRRARREVELAEPPGDADPAVLPTLLDQLASRDELIREVVGERRFAVLVDGRPAAFCMLYSRDGIGQVELVTTKPEHRNRGYGRAIVCAATAASWEQGNELTFLVALADDWPRQLYRRLGFEPAGLIHRFRRPARGQRTSSLPLTLFGRVLVAA